MIRTEGRWFKDEHGRTRILRGVNLGGSSKVPSVPNGATYNREGFFDHRQVSFVGRPFPLAEAGEHFGRLAEWGQTFLRFLVTWEAVEHAGPGLYDTEYLDYLAALVSKAGEYGLELFIDPHQDMWSRFSGGDGAPGWTFDAIGMDVTRFAETGAAVVHQIYGDPLPRMIWPTNGGKLAAATLFTLFFAGSDLAPLTWVEGEPVQEYLQRHYLAAMQQVAMRLKGLPHVCGYDTLNEPLSGYVGCTDLNTPGGLLWLGDSPSPFQSMLLGAGIPQEVGVWNMRLLGPKKVGSRLMNPKGLSVWKPGYECVWKQNGVWSLDAAGQPCLLRPNHFADVRGRMPDFNDDYLRPFANRYAQAIRAVDPEALIFVETEPQGALPVWGEADAKNIVSAPHYYDDFTLFRKQYVAWMAYDVPARKVVIGPKNVQRMMARHVGELVQAAETRRGNVPTLIGEFGIPFDMEHKKAYRTGDFRSQVKALDRSYQAMDENLVSCTLWNYTSDNTNARGDLWNDEDLSIFSRDQQANPVDVNSGGRALEAVVRPYAQCVAGQPLRMSFDLKHRVFELEYQASLQVQAPTEIFVPHLHYPHGCKVEISGGRYELHAESQKLLHFPLVGGDTLQRVRISPLK